MVIPTTFFLSIMTNYDELQRWIEEEELVVDVPRHAISHFATESAKSSLSSSEVINRPPGCRAARTTVASERQSNEPAALISVHKNDEMNFTCKTVPYFTQQAFD